MLPSPATLEAKGEEGDAEDEEHKKGDDAHLWGWEPGYRLHFPQHTNHFYGSHCPAALWRKAKRVHGVIQEWNQTGRITTLHIYIALHRSGKDEVWRRRGKVEIKREIKGWKPTLGATRLLSSSVSDCCQSFKLPLPYVAHRRQEREGPFGKVLFVMRAINSLLCFYHHHITSLPDTWSACGFQEWGNVHLHLQIPTLWHFQRRAINQSRVWERNVWRGKNLRVDDISKLN